MPRLLRNHRALLAALLVMSVLLAGCGGKADNSVITQGGGLPTLHRLDWGFAYTDMASYSPDGQWIAMLAGPDSVNTHLEVMHPDSSAKHDLSIWGCSDPTSFTFAWLPNNELSCVTHDGRLLVAGEPFAYPHAIAMSGILKPGSDLGGGSAWSPDGGVLIVDSATLPNDPNITSSMLFAVSPLGHVTDTPLAPPPSISLQGSIDFPAWVPHTSDLSYIQQEDPYGGSQYDLWESDVTLGSGTATVGAPRMLVGDVFLNYAWSPSGRWVAVRYGNPDVGDKIYLVNAADPTQTVDVVLADKAGVQMDDPIWSPDGRTLIVFSVGYESAQPYAIDIGTYLQSKGLQV